MGVTKLGSKFVRDLIQVITKPITDNAGQIKERIQGLYVSLAVSKITGLIELSSFNSFRKSNPFPSGKFISNNISISWIPAAKAKFPSKVNGP